MGKYFVIGLALLSGVGTVPCLVYLIYMYALEQYDENKAKQRTLK